MANLTVQVQDGNNINVDVVATPRQTIVIDRGIAGVGVESAAIVYIAPNYFFEFTYTNGTTELVELPPIATGVLSFNTRIGVVTLTNTDVTGALGYTPVQPNGTGASGTWSISIDGNAATVTNGVYTTDTGTVTNTMLAGSIANNKLVNSTITVNGTSTALGSSVNVGTVTNVSATAGTGIAITGSPISTTGTLNITNTAPDQVVSLTSAGTTNITGTYPNFTVTSNDQFDGTVTSVSGTGTVNGISLSGTVTESGNLTLGGALTGVSLTTQVSGTLPIANGGTNATTASGARTSLGLGTSAVLDSAVALGTATLDAGGTVPLSQIPASIQGGLIYQGTWNASTNTPTLTSSVGSKGHYYAVSVAGTTDLNGITDWNIGDLAVYNGTSWEQIDNTDAVTSVNGFTGTVVLTTSHVAEGTNEYFTTAKSRSSISAGTGISYDNTSGVVTNASPDQTVSLTGTGTTSIIGTYPNFTVNSNDQFDGTVTNVAATVPSFLSVSGSPITTSGTLSLSYSGIALPVANGGTGAITESAALSSLGAYPATNPSGYTSNVGTVTAVSGASPIVSSGGVSPEISITAATTIAAGSMSATDKNKLDNIAANATANEGTVTNVSGTGAVNGISLSGTVTSSGNLTLGGALTGVSLSTQVTGTLPVSSGGTGASTLTANSVLLGNGTGALQAVAPSTSGNVLTSNGTTWTSSPAGASLFGDTNSASPFETSLGYQAGNVNTGANNTFIGYQAGVVNSTGTNNTAIGTGAFLSNQTGGFNTVVGHDALRQNTGSNNSAFGQGVMRSNTSGFGNVAIGNQSLYSNTTNGANTAIGYIALYTNTGANNTATGYEALRSNTTASGNTANGYRALRSNTTGTRNVAVGFDALYSNTTGTDNTSLGYQALDANSTGANNTAVGRNALGANTTGTTNTSIGSNSLDANTTGPANTAVGAYSMTSNTTGGYNTAIGDSSLQNNTSGINNVSLGFATLQLNTTANDNTAVGHQALSVNITGASNTAVGSAALGAVTAGNNTAMGYRAGFSGTNNLTTGGNNILIGYNATATSATVSNETTIGNSSTTSARIFGKLSLQNGSFAGISSTVASASTITPTSDTTNQYTVTALATAATIAIPTGTPADGQRLTLRFKDNGAARALTWTTSAGGYRVVGVTLPTTTVLSKVLYVGCIYNSQDSFWDVVSIAQQE